MVSFSRSYNGVNDVLILTRQVDEAIIIGNAVKVKVLGLKGNQVRLGIEAPDSVKILRAELVDHESLDRDTGSFELGSSR